MLRGKNKQSIFFVGKPLLKDLLQKSAQADADFFSPISKRHQIIAVDRKIFQPQAGVLCLQFFEKFPNGREQGGSVIFTCAFAAHVCFLQGKNGFHRGEAEF